MDLIEKAKNLLPRKIEPHIYKNLFQKGIIVLLGARQVGKTSLMLRLMKYLVEEKGISSSQIDYLDLEYPHLLSQIDGIYGDEFIKFLKARGVDTEKQTFVFIDEVHYLGNPSSFLKTIYDHHPNIKLIVSGSSTLQIKHKFEDALTGRKRIFEIAPLDFEEFLLFKDSRLLDRKKKLNIGGILNNKSLPDISELKYLKNEIWALFEEFVVFGGYPEVVLLSDEGDKRDLLSEIYSSYVRKDIKDFSQINNVTGFNHLIELLSFQIGNILNISELTLSARISRKTLENYLFLLENTYIISLLSPYYSNRRKEIVKSPKVFFRDTGIRNSIVRNFDPLDRRGDRGELFENAVFLELLKNLRTLQSIHYWRTKTGAETDFIIRDKEILPIEVKYTISKGSRIPSGLRSFIRSYKIPTGFVVSKDRFDKNKIFDTMVFFIPSWAV